MHIVLHRILKVGVSPNGWCSLLQLHQTPPRPSLLSSLVLNETKYKIWVDDNSYKRSQKNDELSKDKDGDNRWHRNVMVIISHTRQECGLWTIDSGECGQPIDMWARPLQAESWCMDPRRRAGMEGCLRWASCTLERRRPREAGLTEQRQPPAPCSARITCPLHFDLPALKIANFAFRLCLLPQKPLRFGPLWSLSLLCHPRQYPISLSRASRSFQLALLLWFLDFPSSYTTEQRQPPSPCSARITCPLHFYLPALNIANFAFRLF